jgi:hypothetical protein
VAACDLTTTLAGLLTPLIAIFAGYIARQQWRTAKNKLKLDLFDRRMTIYTAVESALHTMVRRHKIDAESLAHLRSAREAKWLFNDEIAEYDRAPAKDAIRMLRRPAPDAPPKHDRAVEPLAKYHCGYKADTFITARNRMS